MNDTTKKRAVWNKGAIIPGSDPDTYRRDVEGNIIRWDEYGLETEQGWEIDHIIPVSKGGSDDLSNLQPLQTAANRRKADKLR